MQVHHTSYGKSKETIDISTIYQKMSPNTSGSTLLKWQLKTWPAVTVVPLGVDYFGHLNNPVTVRILDYVSNNSV